MNGPGTASYWSNDGTSTAGSEPTAAVAISVSNGVYSVLLGDTSLASMTAIPLTVFANTTGSNNTANGSFALHSNTTGDQNVAIGNSALFAQSFSNTSTPYNSNNVALGGHLDRISLLSCNT